MMKTRILTFFSPFFSFQDQFTNVAAHTLKGIDFLDKYGNFVKDRCAIEIEYAAKLRWESFIRFWWEEKSSNID